jgi:hypothetical protein
MKKRVVEILLAVSMLFPVIKVVGEALDFVQENHPASVEEAVEALF